MGWIDSSSIHHLAPLASAPLPLPSPLPSPPPPLPPLDDPTPPSNGFGTCCCSAGCPLWTASRSFSVGWRRRWPRYASKAKSTAVPPSLHRTLWMLTQLTMLGTMHTLGNHEEERRGAGATAHSVPNPYESISSFTSHLSTDSTLNSNSKHQDRRQRSLLRERR